MSKGAGIRLDEQATRSFGKHLAPRMPLITTIAAPSCLAVDLARQFGITLVGFVREERFVAYTEFQITAAGMLWLWWNRLVGS
jgi:hypothetical protein